MEVIAETQFLFRGDKSAVVHSWKDFGLKLYVPEGSTAEFRVRLVHSTKFVLPEGTESMSPVYWITSKGETTGKVGVEIQHWAEALDEEHYGLEFAAYKMENPELPYVFKTYPVHFSSSPNYGRMDVDFSDWIFVIKKFFRKIPKLLAKLYYCKNRDEAHIVMVSNGNNDARVSYYYYMYK